MLPRLHRPHSPSRRRQDQGERQVQPDREPDPALRHGQFSHFPPDSGANLKPFACLADADIAPDTCAQGHSLGSALASLCYARFLASESDLGPDLKLKDCYVFGTPRLGDGDFASAFEHNLATPLDRANILWRVRDHVDLVCSVPPGVTDAESLRGTVSSSSLLNYAHLGPEIRVFPVLPYSPPYWKANELGAFHEATEVRVTGGHASQQELMQAGGGLDLRKTSARVGAIEGSRGGKNWLRWALALLPSPLYDHCAFPFALLASLPGS